MGSKTVRRRRRARAAIATTDGKNGTSREPRDEGYDIGYGKPPRSTQFKPGQSGNPRGRPQGSKNLATLIDEELSTKVAVNEGGTRRVLPKRAVIVKRFVNKAAEGDIRTLLALLKVQESMLTDTEHGKSQDHEEALGPDDRAILKAFESKLLHRLEQPDANAKHPSQPARKRRKK